MPGVGIGGSGWLTDMAYNTPRCLEFPLGELHFHRFNGLEVKVLGLVLDVGVMVGVEGAGC